MLTRRDFLKLIPGAAGVAAGLGVAVAQEPGGYDGMLGVSTSYDVDLTRDAIAAAAEPAITDAITETDYGWHATYAWLDDDGAWTAEAWVRADGWDDAEKKLFSDSTAWDIKAT